jgi:hypothetical protein
MSLKGHKPKYYTIKCRGLEINGKFKGYNSFGFGYRMVSKPCTWQN